MEDTRHPLAILADYDLLVTGGTRKGILVTAGREVLWEILNDVLDTVRLACEAAATPETEEILTTVQDYLAYHYGDDE